MPEELVYNMTKTLFENIDTLAASQKIANEINLEEATNIAGLELHPGAEKYFKEVGAIK
ncbi:Hypothetical protein ING2D1G_1053 [Peptoniphilus sp. ING2-D1G]|nr:Hypothetical protein ING2D1G_1053 [Peptoniphilus sp. ING2-D1G]